MLDKTSRHFFPVADPALFPAVFDALARESQLELQQTAPNVWTGKARETRYLCHYKMTLSYQPSFQGGATLELRAEAEPDTGAIIILVISMFCLLPGAILFLLAYLDFDSWVGRVMRAAWAPVGRSP